MINKLARLGYSITHGEINRFKRARSSGEFPESITQWSGDNVDYNIATLDGQGSFRGMGIISMTVPCSLSRLQPDHYS